MSAIIEPMMIGQMDANILKKGARQRVDVISAEMEAKPVVKARM
jgi:hypothetical protein